MTSKAALVLILVYMYGIQGAPDNRGTEFVIGYMENFQTAFNLELFVTTSRTTTVNVKVTAPKYPSANLNEQFTVTAGTVKQITFTNDLRLIQTEFSSKGILVEADDEVVIYGINKEAFSTDGFVGLPTDVLGKRYYAACYYPPTRNTEILIVGVEDNTQVTIKLGSHSAISFSYNGVNYVENDVLNININRFDTFQIATVGDLTGTYITSDKKISVFSGNRKTNIGSGGSQDHLVEQLTPVDVWGTDFATVPIPDRTTGDYFRFIASESNTQVKVDGQISGTPFTDSFTIINAGDFIQRLYSSELYSHVTSDKPIMLVQYVLSQQTAAEPADPSMMIIPPMKQFGADYTFSTPKYSQGSYINYFMFVVKDNEKTGLMLNGASISGVTYNKIPGTEYVGGFINIPDGSYTVRHQSPISVFGGYLFGRANAESYAFPTGMRLAPINVPCVPSRTVTGDGLDNDCDGRIDEELCTTENNRKDDDGDGVSDEDCATPPPVDGNWASWLSWGTCSITCTPYGTTATGTKSRSRTCTDPAPAYDGKQCVDSSTESASCTVPTYCPVNGAWAIWGSWQSCSVTCESGIANRQRTCTNPPPAYGGTSCSGSSMDTQTCTLPNCPIDGQWTVWTSWDTCTVTCGGGGQGRTRSCTNPAPQYGGANCVGVGSEKQSCNTQMCIIDGAWSVWGAWGMCSVTCGVGKYSRSRTCSNPYPLNGGLPCSGDSSVFGDCNTQACPTAAAGAYIQLCPAGWFTCQKGSVSCIDSSFVCNCAKECDDGSDESVSYASCDPRLKALCPNAELVTAQLSFVCLLTGIILALGNTLN